MFTAPFSVLVSTNFPFDIDAVTFVSELCLFISVIASFNEPALRLIVCPLITIEPAVIIELSVILYAPVNVDFEPFCPIVAAAAVSVFVKNPATVPMFDVPPSIYNVWSGPVSFACRTRWPSFRNAFTPVWSLYALISSIAELIVPALMLIVMPFILNVPPLTEVFSSTSAEPVNEVYCKSVEPGDSTPVLIMSVVKPALYVKSVPPASIFISKSTPELFCSILKKPSSVTLAVSPIPASVIFCAILSAVSPASTVIVAVAISNSAVFPSSETLFVEIVKEPSLNPLAGTLTDPRT